MEKNLKYLGNYCSKSFSLMDMLKKLGKRLANQIEDTALTIN